MYVNNLILTVYIYPVNIVIYINDYVLKFIPVLHIYIELIIYLLMTCI